VRENGGGGGEDGECLNKSNTGRVCGVLRTPRKRTTAYGWPKIAITPPFVDLRSALR